MAEREVHLTKDVFVAGAEPKVTYNPRDERHLEEELATYLDQGPGRALTVYGPTKSGKTVLVERKLPRDLAIWAEGPDLKGVDDFWKRVIDWLGLYDLVEVSRLEAEGTGRQLGFKVDAKVVGVDARKSDDTMVTASVRKSRNTALVSVARDALETVDVTLVVDDFHYIEESLKQDLVRAIKTVIKFCKVVLIAVPHEAFTAVRKESDMSGRISQLGIDAWTDQELRFIAERGFEALNITDHAGIGETLAASSYGAPLLMQDHCFQYVTTVLKLLQTADEAVPTVEPDDWGKFFTRIANRTPSEMFDELLRGPKIRGQEREARIFKTGETTDIYGALLHAIAKVGKASVTNRELAKVIERDFVEVPGGSTITASLGQMSKIAMSNRGDSEPVLAYKDGTLHILDPFLLFYLRYGTWTVEKDLKDEPVQEELPVEAPDVV